MGFDFFSPILLDIKIWAIFDPISERRQKEGLRKDHNISFKTGLKSELLTTKKKHCYLIFLLQLEYSI